MYCSSVLCELQMLEVVLHVLEVEKDVRHALEAGKVFCLLEFPISGCEN